MSGLTATGALHEAAALSGIAMTWVRIVLIVLAAIAARFIGTRLIRGFRDRYTARVHDPEHARRAETLVRAFRYLTSVIVALVAGMLILSELGVSLAPILGAAGVVGLAVGFGAQSLVRDYVTGFFLLLENQLAKGDVVQVADKSGTVEDVTLRYLQLRDYEGNVHFIPNGLITTVTNMSRGYAYAVMDVGVAYHEDVDQALLAMRTTAADLRADPAFAPYIMEEFEIAGVERLSDSGVFLRGRFKVQSLQQWDVRREYFRRLKRVFDERGIEFSLPRLALRTEVTGEETASARRQRQTDPGA
ncbi:MAG TPA: mechanosensitive ion channel family protein [Steroidobacteraceae bacterium]|nr:mechanosensitive ion channel family protein [Steroidobacteraceae bacterium]